MNTRIKNKRWMLAALLLCVLLLFAGCSSTYKVETLLFEVSFLQPVELEMQTLSAEGITLETGSYFLKTNGSYYVVSTVDYKPYIDMLWEEHTQSETAFTLLSEESSKESIETQGGSVSAVAIEHFAGRDAVVCTLDKWQDSIGYGKVYTFAADNRHMIVLLYFAVDGSYDNAQMQAFFDSFRLK